MSSSRFGGFLLGIGVAVGIGAVVGLATGFEPSRLPAALLDVAVYKLTFAAAAGLLAAGAIVRRYARRDGERVPPPATAAGEPLAARPALPDSTNADAPQPGAPRPKVEVPKRA
jgi:hypothetical protein